METIKIYGCRYVCEYSDGMPLSSSEHNFRTKEERAEFLSEYDEDEIIDGKQYLEYYCEC